MSDDMAAAEEREAEVTAVIRRARQLLARGWCQDTSAIQPESPTEAQFCLSGAIHWAAGELAPDRLTMLRLAQRAVARVYQSLPDGTESVIAYNDKPGRRQSTILRRMDIAAGGK